MGIINISLFALLLVFFVGAANAVESIAYALERSSLANLFGVLQRVHSPVSQFMFCVLGAGMAIRVFRSYSAPYYAMVLVLETLDDLAWQRARYRSLTSTPGWMRRRHHRARAQRNLLSNAHKLRRQLDSISGDPTIGQMHSSGMLLGKWMNWAAEDLHDRRRSEYLVQACIDTIHFLLEFDSRNRLSIQYPPRQVECKVPPMHKRLVDIRSILASPAAWAGFFTCTGAFVSLVQKSA